MYDTHGRKKYVEELFPNRGLPTPPRSSWNVAPTHHMPVVLTREGERHEVLARWGYWPSWADAAFLKSQPRTNARDDTVLESRMWRPALESRRCIVPVTGFYEWIGPPRKKLPFYFHPRDREIFYVPGIWDARPSLEHGEIVSFAMCTTEPNEALADIHDRALVILSPEDARAWLDPGLHVMNAHAMLKPCPPEWIARRAVSNRVNPSFGEHYVNEPSLIEPLAAPAQRSLFGAA